jgi:hypothetical protein
VDTPFDAATNLCTSCGLCCSGVVLSGVLLAPAELPWAAKHRLPIVETPRGPAFAQPCALLVESRCGGYEGRPGACRRFVCDLLAGVEAGERELSGAVGEVVALRAEVSALEAQMEPASRARTWQLAALVADPTTPPAVHAASLAELGPLASALAALRARIDAKIVSPERNAARLARSSPHPESGSR